MKVMTFCPIYQVIVGIDGGKPLRECRLERILPPAAARRGGRVRGIKAPKKPLLSKRFEVLYATGEAGDEQITGRRGADRV